MSRKVIVDVDVGVDDAFALLMLLSAEKQGIVEIVAITCANGNTSVYSVFTNVQKILKTMNREDIPVYVGAFTQLITLDLEKRYFFHGKDGLGDLEYETDGLTPKTCVHNQTKIDDKDKYFYPDEFCDGITESVNAISALYELVRQYPKEITLLCLAPLTNIALAIRVYPDFVENVKDCFIMGGNYRGVGNVTSAAEFNFHTDPEAAYIVLNSKLPLTILPWETCLDTKIPFVWRTSDIGTIDHPVMKLINAAEHRIYPEDEKYWNPCDAFLIVAFIDSRLILQSEPHNISVELQGVRTRGQMVLDHMKTAKTNASVITEIDYSLFKHIVRNYLTQSIK